NPPHRPSTHIARPRSPRTAPPYRPPANPLYLPPRSFREWGFAAATTSLDASAIAPGSDPATAPAVGPKSAHSPARACPAPLEASVAHAARRPESTRATSPPNAAHTRSRSLARSASARAPTGSAHTSPAAPKGSADPAPPPAG